MDDDDDETHKLDLDAYRDAIARGDIDPSEALEDVALFGEIEAFATDPPVDPDLLDALEAFEPHAALAAIEGRDPRAGLAALRAIPVYLAEREAALVTAARVDPRDTIED